MGYGCLYCSHYLGGAAVTIAMCSIHKNNVSWDDACKSFEENKDYLNCKVCGRCGGPIVNHECLKCGVKW